jgi:hypothetical protein
MLYVDLNPVRAGVVSRPEDYPWSGIGALWNKDNQDGIIDEAAFLSEVAPETYARLKRASRRLDKRIRRRAKKNYLWLLYYKGARRKKGKASICEADRERIINCKDYQPEWTTTRHRQYSDGCAIGSKQFVQSVYQQHKSVFRCKHDKKGIKVELMDEEMHCLKRLRRTG